MTTSPTLNAEHEPERRAASGAALKKLVALGGTFLLASTVAACGGDAKEEIHCGLLEPGQSLDHEQLLDSCNDQFHLKMQADGNLVLYRGQLVPSNATWATGTWGTDGQTATMQSDGNFVLSSKSTVLWSSGTSGHPAALLRLEDSGEFKVMTDSTVLWHATPGDVNAAGVNHRPNGGGGCSADSDCGSCQRCERSMGNCIARLTCG